MSDTRPDTGHDKALTVVYRLLLGALAGVIAVVFALSFYGLKDYAQHRAGLPGKLAWLVPVGLDVMSLCALAATYLLRHAPRRVRTYAWCAFGVPTLLSVAGNVSHGELRGLRGDGMVGAAAWPVLVALAAHLVIVVRRHMDQTRPTTQDDTEQDSDQDRAERIERILTTAALDPATTTPDPDKHATAKARRKAGATIAEIAADLGVSERTVQRWTDGVKPAARRSRSARRTAPAIRTRPDGQDATPTGHTDTTPATPAVVDITPDPDLEAKTY